MKELQSAAEGGLHKVAHGVYVGALMSPADVARATQRREGAAYRALQRWTLCGDVSPTLFCMLRAAGWPDRIAERLTVLTGEVGHYWVMTHQLAGFQHRFLAPLFDDAVANCVRAAAAGETLGYSLAGEGNQAMVWGSPLSATAFAPVAALCRDLAEGQEEAALADYAQALQEVRHPERIPSLLERSLVRHASVTAIPPKKLLEQVTARYGVRP